MRSQRPIIHWRYLTPWFSCKHAITLAPKPHPKSACVLQRSLGGIHRFLLLIRLREGFRGGAR